MALLVKKISFALLSILLFQAFAFAVDDLGPRKNLFKIKKISIKGSRKVEQEAILEKISSKEGMVLDNYLLRRDLEKIYSMKYFQHVEAHQVGAGGLEFHVKEKPLITKVLLDGNDEIDDEDITALLKTKEFSILDINTIKIDVKAIQKHYEEKGFYLASVDYELKEIDTENKELIFRIKEFDKVRVKDIIFLGNSAFTDAQLQDIMETREEGLFSFMSGAGNFKEFNFNTDIERIKYFYKTKGHLQVNVGSPEITVSEDKKWVFITIRITEGPQFSVNEISFNGEVLFPEEELLEKIELKTGIIYSEETLRKDIQMLTEMYQDEGYAFANVLRTLNVVPGENKVNVDFSFEKGKIAYFGEITVKGNTKTRDKVIRRELRIREGVKFSGTDLRRSRENVNRLGFFEPGSVVFNTVTPEGKDDVLDVVINVKERNTGQISLGAGYSTATGAFMQASISQNNFRGLGQNLSFSLSLARDTKSFNVGFVEPYLFDTKWTAGGDIFRTTNELSDSLGYKEEGFNLRVGYPIFDYTRLFLTYKFEDTEIQSVSDSNLDASRESGLASSLRLSVVRDLRDNTFEPSKGYYLSMAGEYAGVGGDRKWWLSEVDGRFFHRVWGDLVFRSRLFASKLEVVDNRYIPRARRFSLGGTRNLRGFDFEAVGPHLPGTLSNGRVRSFNQGSLFASYGTIELEHPLAREAGLKWVVFMDAGDADKMGNFKLHKDYGFGFRWFSPIGVLRFEFGWPLDDPDNGEGRASQFHFDIGQLF